MTRLALALATALALAGVVPAGSWAAGELFVLSQRDNAQPATSITGLVQLADAGGEALKSGTGGAVITGTGAGPIVYNSGGSGSISTFSGGTYKPLLSGVGGGIRSMTVTGRGLVVANTNKLQYASSSGLSDVPYGTIPDGPWISITTEPNGLLLGWAWRSGIGRLYEFNLGSGAVTTQDFFQSSSPLLNNCLQAGACGSAPVPNSGGISADGQGGIWVAGAGTATGTVPDSQSSQIYYAAPTTGNFSFNSIDVMYTRPHISATGTGTAYASTTDNNGSPYISDVYKLNPSGPTAKVTSSGGKLTNSFLPDLAVDRCYAACSVAPPNIISPQQKLTAPKKTIKLGKKGLNLKLKCSIACSVTVSGKLAFGKAKKATAAASNKLKTTKAKLKAGKSKTVVIKLSKSQRKRVKRALRRKQKVIAKLKIVVKAKGVKTVTRRPKLRVK
jgi:hypothetical protein